MNTDGSNPPSELPAQAGGSPLSQAPGVPNGLPYPEFGPSPVPDIPPIVIDSRPCLSCGYDLKGLASAGVCPECNSPVIRSLYGNLLRYASLDYLKTLKQGCLIVELSFAASIILGGLGIAMAAASSFLVGFARAGEFLSAGAEALAAAISLVGWWIFTTPDPGLLGEDAGTNSRKVLRFALIGGALFALAKFSLTFAPGFSQAARDVAFSGVGTSGTTSGTPGNNTGFITFGGTSAVFGPGISVWPMILLGGVSIINLGFTITKFFASMYYLRGIVRRMPDPALEVHVRRFMWTGPLLVTVGLLLCGTGPIIAFVLNWVIIDKVRQRLNAAAVMAVRPNEFPPASAWRSTP